MQAASNEAWKSAGSSIRAPGIRFFTVSITARPLLLGPAAPGKASNFSSSAPLLRTAAPAPSPTCRPRRLGAPCRRARPSRPTASGVAASLPDRAVRHLRRSMGRTNTPLRLAERRPTRTPDHARGGRIHQLDADLRITIALAGHSAARIAATAGRPDRRSPRLRGSSSAHSRPRAPPPHRAFRARAAPGPTMHTDALAPASLAPTVPARPRRVAAPCSSSGRRRPARCRSKTVRVGPAAPARPSRHRRLRHLLISERPDVCARAPLDSSVTCARLGVWRSLVARSVRVGEVRNSISAPRYDARRTSFGPRATRSELGYRRGVFAR